MIKYLKKIFFGKTEINYLRDVFTPSSAAILTYVSRPDLNKQVEKALDIKGHQIIIYGHTGSGKTTLIQNLLREKGFQYIVTNCMSETTFASLVLEAFDKLNPFYTKEIEDKEANTISSELKATYLAIDATIKRDSTEEHTEKQERALPVQLTAQKLTELLGATKTLWVIEDFHKVKIEERTKFSQLLKVFVDTSNRYADVKVIAIGAVGTARDVVNYDNELNTRVAEIYVPLLSQIEIESIITKGEQLLNIEFMPELKKGIMTYCLSLAAICHHLCYSICYDNDIHKTQIEKKRFDKSYLEAAIKDYVTRNSDTHKKNLDKLFKEDSDNHVKNILRAISNELAREELSLKEITDLINKRGTSMSTEKISNCLLSLTTVDFGEILRYDENSGKFSFNNPFFNAYTKMYFDGKLDSSLKTDIRDEVLRITLQDLFSELKNAESDQKTSKLE